jgi:hypothetical protein
MLVGQKVEIRCLLAGAFKTPSMDGVVVAISATGRVVKVTNQNGTVPFYCSPRSGLYYSHANKNYMLVEILD